MAGNELKRELNIDDDLRYLVNDLSNAKHKAIDIAVQLGIKKATRDTIASSAKDAVDMLRKVLEEFLQGNGSEPVTRESIIGALESASVQLPLIAEEMRKKYSSSPTGSQESYDDSSDNIPTNKQFCKIAPQTTSSPPDSGFYSCGSKRKLDSSDDALAPETLPMKLLCVSHTEYAATRIPCPAPTGTLIPPESMIPNDSGVSLESTSDGLQEYNKLFKGAILECRKVFTKLRVDVCSTCISSVGYQEIKEITVPYADSPSQLQIGLSTAKSWDSVWKYLDAYTGWENSKPIEMLAMKKGSERDRQNLDEFTRKRKWLLELLEWKYVKRTKKLILKLDEEYNEFKEKNLEVMRLQLCSLLSCYVTVLKMKRGCVMITVAIPAENAEDVFPFSPAMRENFQQVFPSIISVTCGKIKERFQNTHYSEEEEKEDTESQDEEREKGENDKSGDEEGYIADESGSYWSSGEEQESGERHAGQSEESREPQVTHDRDINATGEQEADVEQEGRRMRVEGGESLMTGSREDKNLEAHVSESRELEIADYERSMQWEGEEGEWKEREYERSLEESGEGGKKGLEESGEGRKAGLEKGSWEAEVVVLTAPIRGSDIVARTIVPLQLAAGEGCSYEWKGHGLRLTVPADALEPLGHYYDLPWQPQLLRIEQPEVKTTMPDINNLIHSSEPSTAFTVTSSHDHGFSSSHMYGGPMTTFSDSHGAPEAYPALLPGFNVIAQAAPSSQGALQSQGFSSDPQSSTMSQEMRRQTVPADMKTLEYKKVERKKARNRIAASKCRLRRLQRESDLQEKVRRLKDHNQELNNELNSLRKKVHNLKRVLMKHMRTDDCNVDLLQ